jgi:hypothetical protein
VHAQKLGLNSYLTMRQMACKGCRYARACAALSGPKRFAVSLRRNARSWGKMNEIQRVCFRPAEFRADRVEDRVSGAASYQSIGRLCSGSCLHWRGIPFPLEG